MRKTDPEALKLVARRERFGDSATDRRQTYRTEFLESELRPAGRRYRRHWMAWLRKHIRALEARVADGNAIKSGRSTG